MQEVIVTNNGTTEHKDAFQGIRYVFPVGGKTQMPLKAAVHCFGLGLDDRSGAWRRLGFTNEKDGMAFLKRFTLKVVDMVPDDNEETLALRKTVTAFEQTIPELKQRIKTLEDDNAALRKQLEERSTPAKTK